MSWLTPRPYNPTPCYPPIGHGEVRNGWAEAVASLPAGGRVIAVDGPAILDWDALLTGLTEALRDQRSQGSAPVDTRDYMLPWAEIVATTSSPGLADDPDFEKLADGTLRDLFRDLPTPDSEQTATTIVYGPGAALTRHDVLWYADLPKRYAEARVTAGEAANLGQPEGEKGTTKRLFYIDWPLLDRHRDSICGHIDAWLDTQDPASVKTLDGLTLRETIKDLASRPFRTRPTFNTTSWGGHWAQDTLGISKDKRNTALGYELIAPESGVLIGDREHHVEIPFQLIVGQQPERILGTRTHETFGTSFPVRFDYLDTKGGGSLSVHCHPRAGYMSDVFGWPYTQHETYYMMVGGQDRRVFLGLRGDADIGAFHQAATKAHQEETPFDITEYVQTFAAAQHQLFLIPAGTPHGSGEGNVVLEVSATPYLYSLRFYDWLRKDAEGHQRPVHVEHAFSNLDTQRKGADVENDLVQRPRTTANGDGWREELIGALPEMFFEVRRLVIDDGATAADHTQDRFHVLNVVEGDGVLVETTGGDHTLAYAETLVVPASAGAYTLRPLGGRRAMVIKAQVR